MEINVMENILDRNDQMARSVNEKLSRKGIFVFNLLGSPGCGKTTLLEKLIANLKSKVRVAVIEGDLFTSKDAQRIEAHHIPVIQINTGGGCHLDAAMVERALNKLDLDQLDVLVIENVGNLVCPAEFNIGEDVKVTVLSVTEGEDKPLKYPLIFKEAAVTIINKMDLLPYTGFDLSAAREDILSIHPQIKIIEASSQTGEGLDVWYEWILEQVKVKKSRSHIE